MHKLLHYTMYVTFSSLFGCTTTQVATNSQEFNDDLSAYRIVVDEAEIPVLEEEVVEDVAIKLPQETSEQKLDQFLTGMQAFHNKSKTVPGYRLLIYSGYDRDRAFELKEELAEVLGMEAAVQYEQPNYRVKLGNFLNRVDAHSLYTKLKRDFPMAIIIQDGLLKEDLKRGDKIIEEVSEESHVSPKGKN